MQVLAGKVAFVTGASTGIGRATSVALARAGAKVVAVARREAELARTIEAVEAAGGVGLAVVADVSSSADVRSAVDRTIDEFGSLDLAFNNAGVEGGAFPVSEYPEDTWDTVLAINLTGVFLCLKYELPHIVRAKGSVVNMASIAGLVGGHLGAAYYASKHGVVGLTKAAAVEYASKGVRINAVAPAVIPTPLTERAFFHSAELTARLTALHPMKRFGTVEEVANAVVWLLSPASSFTTGHVLAVDGGFLVP